MDRIITDNPTPTTIRRSTYSTAKVSVIDVDGSIASTYDNVSLSSEITGPKKSKAPGDCIHFKCLEPATGIRAIVPGGHVHRIDSGGFTLPIIDRSLVDPAFNGVEHSLNWKKLTSSNEAGLLQNLAELDDTVAMMTVGIAKSMSYGGYQWGWKPLIADSLAVIDVVKRCAKFPPGAPQPYVDSNVITKVVNIGGPGLFADATVTVKRTEKLDGFVTVPLDILSYYDFLGFHPKPSLIWDLIPLSFAIDWFLPIGDMIAQMEPAQGWVKSVSFTGWKMVTHEYTETVRKFSVFEPINGAKKYKVFSRRWCQNIALEQKTVARKPRPPFSHSLSNVGDAAYLAKTFMGDYGPWAVKRKQVPHIDWRQRPSII